MQHMVLALALLLTPVRLSETAWHERADALLRQPVYGCADLFRGDVGGLDAEGYGDTAWSLAYALEALTVLHEATGDRAYLEAVLLTSERLMMKRDHLLAAGAAPDRFRDYARGRVMKAWGTGRYSGGRHTCHLVHHGMLLYPAAEAIRLVRKAGASARDLRARADALERQTREVLAEFDAEWREGPARGMGYYVNPEGAVLPNNWQTAVGRVFLALGDRRSRERAGKILRYVRSKLTLDQKRDCWLWAYSQRGPDGPAGVGEDISHAAITAHFLYLCWERRAGFSRRDVERLARTFTRVIHAGDGAMRGFLSPTASTETSYSAACGRWAFLARLDRTVEDAIRAFLQRSPNGLAGPTGALSFAFLARASGSGRRSAVRGHVLPPQRAFSIQGRRLPGPELPFPFL